MDALRPDFRIAFECENCGTLVTVNNTATVGIWKNVECKHCGESVKIKFEITRDEFLTNHEENEIRKKWNEK